MPQVIDQSMFLFFAALQVPWHPLLPRPLHHLGLQVGRPPGVVDEAPEAAGGLGRGVDAGIDGKIIRFFKKKKKTRKGSFH